MKTVYKIGLKFLVGAMAICVISPLSGQNTFNKLIMPAGPFNYSEGNSIQAYPSGGFVTAGQASNLNTGSDEVYLVRTDDYGVPIWTKTYGGDSSSQSSANCVRVLSDGGFILCGTTNNVLGGDFDLLMMRVDSSGNLIWANSFGGNANETGYSVCQSSDGGFVACGIYGGDSTWSDPSGFVVKTDGAGNFVWSTVFGKAAFQGGVLDAAMSIKALSGGGYAVTGYTENGWGGDKDILVAKLNSTGAVQWLNTYGSVGGEERGYDLIETANQDLVITGYADSSQVTMAEIFILRVSSNGAFLWMKTYSGTDVDLGQCIYDDNGQGFLVTGFTYSFGNAQQVILISTNTTGGLMWAHTMGDMSSPVNNESGNSVCRRGNDIAQVSTTGYFSTGMNIIVSDSVGDVLCNEANVTLIETAYTSSSVDTLADIDFSPVLAIENAFVEAISTPAVIVNCCTWVPAAGFTHSENGLVLSVADSSQSVTAVSSYTWDFGDGNYAFTPVASNTYLNPGTYNVCLVVTNECGSDTFCTSITVIPSSVAATSIDNVQPFVYPNPSAGNVTVHAGNAVVNAIHIEDVQGRTILIPVTAGSGNSFELDTQSLSPGIYFIVIENEDRAVKMKMVKM